MENKMPKKMIVFVRAGTVASILLALGLVSIADRSARAEDKPAIVVTFSILADMVREVGGDHVDMTVLVGADGDTHQFDPLPSHARAMDNADILIANGLGFEEFLPSLIESTGFAGTIIVASDGITPRVMTGGHAGHADDLNGVTEDEGDADGHEENGVDPHAWHDLANARIYVANIAAGLSSADPTNAAAYQANALRYTADIDALDAEIRAAFAAIPDDQRLIITSHDSFGYFGAAYGLTFEGVIGVSTGDDPSAGDIAALIEEINEEGVRALFIENLTNAALIEQIARETGAIVGGEIYSDALSQADGPAPTFLDMMRHNATTIAGALAGG